MSIRRALVHRFVDIQVALMDLEVEPTAGIRTDPGLICDCGALGAIIRKGYKLTFAALAALWPRCYYHGMFSS
jgi:hypothetical protein